ncbi:MAG: alpha/beta fold hydrolase [Streptosporangiales bacterium]|nr:alpha/beta fold hydrolase [Streptosporangiales bacterium]
MPIHDKRPQVTADTGVAEESVAPLADGDIHVCLDGPRDAPALLLIHGSAAFARSWDPLVPLLTGSHRVIRIDLLGSGGSAKPIGGDYAIPEQGRRTGEVLDRLGVAHAVVVGHSGGGLVATALAEQRPDLVTALALIDTGPGLDALIAPESGSVSSSQWPPTEEEVRRLASSGFSREGYEVPQQFVDEVRGMDFAVFAAAMQAPRDYLTQQVAPDRLKVLGKPLLVIFGEEDRRWRPSSADDYRVVPGARVEMLAGVGHSPNMEDPPRTAALLLAFADALPLSVRHAAG